MPNITERQIVAHLRNAVAERGGVRAFGRRHQFVPGFLSRVLNGHTPPSDRLCRAIGFRKVVRYENTRRSA